MRGGSRRMYAAPMILLLDNYVFVSYNPLALSNLGRSMWGREAEVHSQRPFDYAD